MSARATAQEINAAMLTNAELEARALERALAQPEVSRCGRCPEWVFEGTAAECHEAFRAHVAEAHGGDGRIQRVSWTRETIIEAIQAFAVARGKPPTANLWNRRDERGSRPSSVDVVREFGSWAAGIEAAGFEKPRPGRRANGNGHGPPASAVGDEAVEHDRVVPKVDPERVAADDAPALVEHDAGVDADDDPDEVPASAAEEAVEHDANGRPARLTDDRHGWISVRGTGLVYRSPTEGYVAADELEHKAAIEADKLSDAGHDGAAEAMVDSARAQAERIRAAMREAEERTGSVELRTGSGDNGLDEAIEDVFTKLRELLKAGLVLLDKVEPKVRKP
jgi:hypothetical protein